MEKKKFYYCRFLGEVVEVQDWKYDNTKKQVHYLPTGTDVWQTDLSPVDEPIFYESKTECLDKTRDILSHELEEYNDAQNKCIDIFVNAVNYTYSCLDIVSWGKIRELLGAGKCSMLAKILDHENEE